MNENSMKDLSELSLGDHLSCNKKIQERPIWEKSLLTVVEAAKYFQIGESNIRRLTREHRDEDFIVWKDSRVFIRREALEKYLDRTNVI